MTGRYRRRYRRKRVDICQWCGCQKRRPGGWRLLDTVGWLCSAHYSHVAFLVAREQREGSQGRRQPA